MFTKKQSKVQPDREKKKQSLFCKDGDYLFISFLFFFKHFQTHGTLTETPEGLQAEVGMFRIASRST